MKAIKRHLLPLPPVPAAPTKARTAYRRGADYERQIVDLFRQAGELAVRSTGSSGPFDVYVLRPGGGLAIQAKATMGPPSDAQVARWLAGMPEVPDGWQAELWVRVARSPWRRYPH